jgi:hypothetical protein
MLRDLGAALFARRTSRLLIAGLDFVRGEEFGPFPVLRQGGKAEKDRHANSLSGLSAHELRFRNPPALPDGRRHWGLLEDNSSREEIGGAGCDDAAAGMPSPPVLTQVAAPASQFLAIMNGKRQPS